MVGEIVGYCRLTATAVGQSPLPMAAFRGKPCRAFEINHASKSVLVLDPDAKGVAMFDFDQVERMFECDSFSGLLIPKGLNPIQQMEYVGRVFSYPQNSRRDMQMVRLLVIAASLAKGEFTDALYFNFHNPGQ